ncbi:MAG: hypothetical protein GXO89_16805 [Chlorobi bacterium]|nr:hypothetical protein [Chlorobiota bacterium]
MKRIIYLTSIILAGAMISFFSCTKEKVNEQTNQIQRFQENANDGFVVKVLKFKQRMDYVHQHPEYKDGGEMLTDSAVFYMEAALNFVYGYNNLPPGDVETRTSTLDIPDAAVLTTDQIAGKLNEIVQEVASQYNDVQLPGKHLTAVDLKLTDVNGDKQVQVTSAVKGNNGTVDIPHDWWYGLNYGTCDNSNIFEGDAGQRLQFWINEEFTDTPPENCIYMFFDIETENIYQNDIINDYLNTNDETEDDNYLDYLLYYSNQVFTPVWDDSVKCLSANIEMPFYRSSYSSIVSGFLEQYQRKLKQFKVDDYAQGAPEDENEIVWHELEIIMGKRILMCEVTDTIPTPIE